MRKLVGLFLAALVDMCAGVLVVHVMGKAFRVETAAGTYLVGIFLALLPDMDILLQRATKETIDSGHREVGHLPLVWLTLGFLIPFVDGSLFWASITTLCLFWHYLHDSVGEVNQWGVQWLEPFSPNTYSFFARKTPAGHKQLICVWTPQEIAQIRPRPLDEFLEEFYLKPTGESIGTVAMAIVTVLLVIYW